MVRILVALCFLVLASCATTGKYEKVLDSWVGSTESALVSSWGPPANVYVAPNGDRILTYQNNRNVFIPGQVASYQTTVVGNTAYTQAVGGSSAMNASLSCSTSFTISNGKIETWRWKGNDCTSR